MQYSHQHSIINKPKKIRYSINTKTKQNNSFELIQKPSLVAKI